MAFVASGPGGLCFASPCLGSYVLRRLWLGFRVAARVPGKSVRFPLGAVLTLCLGIIAPGPMVLTLSYWFSLDASGVLSILLTMTCNDSAPSTTITASK